MWVSQKLTIGPLSPSLPQHNFSSKDQVFSDGALTHLSVVEIEASDRKPLPEELKALDLFRKEKLSSGGHSSGIGGSSCLSSRQSLSSGDEAEAASAQSAVQYSTVVHSGYRHQVPSVQVFARSESTQPLLDCEERPDELPPPPPGEGAGPPLRQPYFQQSCRPPAARPPPEDPAGPAQLPAFPEGLAADAFGPGAPGEVGGLEAALDLDEGPPQSYLPQTVRPGGYMPQ